MSNIPESIRKQIQNNDPTMRHLDLSNRGLNDDDVSELQELLQRNRYIDSIDLANNNITSDGCQPLSLITTLKKVDLSHCSIGDKGIAYLVKTNIEDLDVSYCGITEEGAKLLQKNLDKYKALAISGNPAILANTLEQIRARFVKKPSVYASPVGIDLGLNIHSSYESYFGASVFEKKPTTDFPNVVVPISREQTLVNKLISSNKEIFDLSTTEKESLILHFSKCLGVNVEIKSTPQNTLKVQETSSLQMGRFVRAN